MNIFINFGMESVIQGLPKVLAKNVAAQVHRNSYLGTGSVGRVQMNKHLLYEMLT
jgi:hypothetical protein